VFVALVAGILAAASATYGDATVESSLSIPARVSVSAESADCQNNPGPHVTLSGIVAIANLKIELVFRNNVKGTHEHVETTTVSAELAPADGSITIPKQPVQGGTGGNPFIWIQFLDQSGNPISGEIFLGRCVQGLDANVVSDLLVPGLATFTAGGDSCDNSPGPYITLTGQISLSGVNARIIFRNNDNPVGGPHKAVRQTSMDIEIVPAGETIHFAKQPVQGGVGGNPRVWIRFDTGNGWSNEIYLGRCKQDL